MNYIRQLIETLLCWLDYHNDWLDKECSWCEEREERKQKKQYHKKQQ